MLNDGQKDQLQRIQARLRAEKPPALEESAAAFDIAIPYTITEVATGPRRRRHRNAMAYTIALSMDTDQSDEDTSPPLSIDNANTVKQKTVITRSPTVKSAPAKTSASPSKTLRRKKRMSVIRQRSSCSLRRKAMLSLPLPERRLHTAESTPHLYRKPSQPRFQAPPPALPLPTTPTTPTEFTVPLGHPSRPLYSAIRKNMSRPSTPTSAGSSNAGPSPADDLRARGMRSLDLPESSRDFVLDDYFSSDIARRPWPVRPNSTGYSLSGEIELRMALARGYNNDPAVTFESAQQPVKHLEKKDLDARVKSKVKRIGKGLKDLMMLRI
ncbi:hypothetical protein EIP91_004597 [Steccherinum ochraceum]|uniref:Uncharacterized protein n=1 Tax=Steccherinum ochraceum TaxID=92696 RepID=A0A4R0RJT7_9APHY|nr:hypothetical protein EIP91_004597 [Steccherinum ochraceum]